MSYIVHNNPIIMMIYSQANVQKEAPFISGAHRGNNHLHAELAQRAGD
jgi:hypothetical protein